MKGLIFFLGKKMCIRIKILSYIRSFMSFCLGSESLGGFLVEFLGYRVCRLVVVILRGTWDGGRIGVRSGQYQGKEVSGGGYWVGVYVFDLFGLVFVQVRMLFVFQQDSIRCFWVIGGGRFCVGGGVMQCVEIISSCFVKILFTYFRYVRAFRFFQYYLNVQNCTLFDFLRNNYWKKKKYFIFVDLIICRVMAFRFIIKNFILFINRIFFWSFVAFFVKIRFFVSIVTILKIFYYVVKFAWSLNVFVL